jgi:hypothetical protein
LNGWFSEFVSQAMFCLFESWTTFVQGDMLALAVGTTGVVSLTRAVISTVFAAATNAATWAVALGRMVFAPNQASVALYWIWSIDAHFTLVACVDYADAIINQLFGLLVRSYLQSNKRGWVALARKDALDLDNDRVAVFCAIVVTFLQVFQDFHIRA